MRQTTNRSRSDRWRRHRSSHRSIEGGSMWNLSLPWWEFVLRGAIVYVFLLVILRITGKRNTGQLAPFDLVLLLVLSNAVQNSMNGGDNTLTGGLVSATTLVMLNYAVGYA